MNDTQPVQAPVSTPTEFKSFPKMARLSRRVIVTEKIDGTNAQVFIGEDGEFAVGSRTRWITPKADNFGFAAWAYAHREELLTLGPGRHFGEWWGHGIQRNYGLPNGDRRFSLFNVQRWCLHGRTPKVIPSGDPHIVKMQGILPPCCGLVPVLDQWEWFDGCDFSKPLAMLRLNGSYAAPGFMNAEGIIAWHVAANVGFKKTLENDDEPKSTLN